jgi:WD40 repeat protein
MAPAPASTHIVSQFKHGSPLISCRYHPSGSHIFYGAQDHGICRWEIGGEKSVRFSGHESWVRGIAFDSAGNTVVSAGFDHRLIWHAAMEAEPKPIRSIEAHDGWVRTVAVSPDNKLLASAGNDQLVKIWDFESGEQLGQLAGHESDIYNVVFHPSEARLVSADLKGKIIDWDLETSTPVREVVCEPLSKYDEGFKAIIGGARSMSFNTDGSLLACSGITGVTNAFAGVGHPTIEIFDWTELKHQRHHRSKDKLKGVAWGAILHPDDFVVGVSGGSGGGFLLFWKPDGEHEFHKIKLPDTARDLALSPDGMDLAIAHFDGHLRIARMAEKPAEEKTAE